MTAATWAFVVFMLSSAVAANVVGRRSRREARARAAELSGQVATEPARASRERSVKSPASTTALSGSLLIAGAASSNGTLSPTRIPTTPANQPVIDVLGVPAPLVPLYEALKALPQAQWSCPVHPVGVDVFDAPEHLVALSKSVGVIETPVYAFLNAAAKNPTDLLIVGPSFSAGTGGHHPFVFLRRLDSSPNGGAGNLGGKSIGVLGKFMSPTVVLLDALDQLDINAQVWDAGEWSGRAKSNDRVDVLIGKTFEGQLHAVQTGQVDYALAIYPYTHDDRVTGACGGGEVCRVDMGRLESCMGERLSGHLLNVLVTNASNYHSDATWRDRAHALQNAVEKKNEQLSGERGMAQADATVQAVLQSGEIDFEVVEHDHADAAALLALASRGRGVGIRDFELEEAQKWIAA